MADKKKDAKGTKKGVSSTELRDLDMLDSKIEKVKGGAGKRPGRRPGKRLRP